MFVAEGSDADSYLVFFDSESPTLKIVGSIEPEPRGNPRERHSLPAPIRTALDRVFQLSGTAPALAEPDGVDILLSPCGDCSADSESRQVPTWVGPLSSAKCPRRSFADGAQIASLAGKEYPRATEWWDGLGPEHSASDAGKRFTVRLMPRLHGDDALDRSDWCTRKSEQARPPD